MKYFIILNLLAIFNLFSTEFISPATDYDNTFLIKGKVKEQKIIFFEIKDGKISGIDQTRQKIITFDYDRSNKIKVKYEYSPNDSLYSHYHYNINNQLTSIKVFNEDKSQICEEVYSNGKILKIFSFDNSELQRTTTFEYNTFNLLSAKISKSHEDKVIEETKYFFFGNKLTKRVKGKTEDLFFYNINGLINKIVTYNTELHTTSYVDITYDNRHNIFTYTSFHYDGLKKIYNEKRLYQYKYFY